MDRLSHSGDGQPPVDGLRFIHLADRDLGGGVLDRSNVLPKSLVTVYHEEWVEDESASLDVIDAGVFFNATTEFVSVRERETFDIDEVE